MESSFSESISYIVFAVFFAFILTVIGLGIQLSQINGFQHYVEQTISSRGGFTAGVKSSIDQESENHYHGLFTLSAPDPDNGINVASDKPAKKGTIIKYKFNVNIKFFENNTTLYSIAGQAYTDVYTNVDDFN